MKKTPLARLAIIGAAGIRSDVFNESAATTKPLPKHNLEMCFHSASGYERKNKSDRKRDRANRWK